MAVKCRPGPHRKPQVECCAAACCNHRASARPVCWPCRLGQVGVAKRWWRRTVFSSVRVARVASRAGRLPASGFPGNRNGRNERRTAQGSGAGAARNAAPGPFGKWTCFPGRSESIRGTPSVAGRVGGDDDILAVALDDRQASGCGAFLATFLVCAGHCRARPHAVTAAAVDKIVAGIDEIVESFRLQRGEGRKRSPRSSWKIKGLRLPLHFRDHVACALRYGRSKSSRLGLS